MKATIDVSWKTMYFKSKSRLDISSVIQIPHKILGFNIFHYKLSETKSLLVGNQKKKKMKSSQQSA